MNFKSRYFTFDGISSETFQLRICRIGNSDDLNIFGVEKTIEEEDGANGIPIFKGVKYGKVSISLSLVKTDGDVIIPFSEQEKFEIVKWLFQDEYKPFIANDRKDVVYYALFTKGSGYENALKQGYINLTMRLNVPYGFSNILSYPAKVEGETFIELDNRSNVGKFVYPDVVIQTLDETVNLKIENLSTGDVMMFKGLPANSVINCYNEGLRQFLVENNPSYNVRKHFEGDWLKLAYGLNKIRITGDRSIIKFIAQSKIALT